VGVARRAYAGSAGHIDEGVFRLINSAIFVGVLVPSLACNPASVQGKRGGVDTTGGEPLLLRPDTPGRRKNLGAGVPAAFQETFNRLAEAECSAAGTAGVVQQTPVLAGRSGRDAWVRAANVDVERMALGALKELPHLVTLAISRAVRTTRTARTPWLPCSSQNALSPRIGPSSPAREYALVDGYRAAGRGIGGILRSPMLPQPR
jgi:hypothetical protein